MTERPRRPTRQELADAAGRTIADIVAPGLVVLFCGINPGLYSGATGHHFARPGNRFWPALHRSGFTRRQLSPAEGPELLRYGLGIVNLVERTTAAAADLTDDEYRRGAMAVEAKVVKYRPRYLAFLGVGAYRVAFDRRKAAVGRQAERLGPSAIWLLPNPSGLNAGYQLPDFVEAFAALRAAAFPDTAGP